MKIQHVNSHYDTKHIMCKAVSLDIYILCSLQTGSASILENITEMVCVMIQEEMYT